VIDARETDRVRLEKFLAARGYRASGASTATEGVSLAKRVAPEIVFLDEDSCGTDFNAVFSEVSAPDGTKVILTAEEVGIDRAIQAMKSGAEYFFRKPLDLDQVAIILDRLEEQPLTAEAPGSGAPGAGGIIVGNSPQMIGVRRMVSLLAKNTATPVLILGESGVGKQMVAKAVHDLSLLPGPLVEINCACLTENLLETELFGHEKGAFTDAKNSKKGLFEVAETGSIFFDEISEMPINLQARLLKVLDSARFRRVGGVDEISTRARFIAATNRDLEQMVKKGLFREDLFYRINVLPVHVPPLRERHGDVVMLADYFAGVLGRGMGKGRVRVSQVAADQLCSYPWPGNVRQLRNVIERALILGEGREILPGHLPSEIRGRETLPASGEAPLGTLREVEEKYIERVLRHTGGNHSRTALTLGISRSTLLAKLKKMGRLH
jgi:two-component system, NtrC family, response regulator AtoC